MFCPFINSQQTMKKYSVLFSAFLLSSLFILMGCNQGQQKESEAATGKDIYLQLYSLRDDIKADYTGTIAAAAEMGYTGVEAAGSFFTCRQTFSRSCSRHRLGSYLGMVGHRNTGS